MKRRNHLGEGNPERDGKGNGGGERERQKGEKADLMPLPDEQDV